MRVFIILIVLIVNVFSVSLASPGFFEKLFGVGHVGGYGGRSYNGYSGGYGGGYNGYAGYQAPRPRQQSGRSYKDICRVINADSYANPKAVPFPAQPFCPF